MVMGLNQWRNIQEVVRYTFQAFHETLQSQAGTIKELQAALHSKVSRSELDESLQASAIDLAARLDKVDGQLASKVEHAAWEAHRREATASLRLHTQALQSQMDLKADDVSLQELRLQQCSSADRLLDLEAQMQQLQQGLLETMASLRSDTEDLLHAKADKALVTAALSLKADAAMTSTALQSKADTAAVNAALTSKADAAAVELMLSSKADADVLERAVHRAMSGLEAASEQLRSRAEADSKAHAATLQAFSGTIEDAVASMRLDAASICASSDQRMAQLEAELAREAAHTRKELVALRTSLVGVNQALETKADLESLDQGALAAIRSQMAAKASMADMCVLLDAKANVEDVNKALLEVSDELSRKVATEELQQALSSQPAQPAATSAEECMGRWLWRSSKTKSGGAVPWNVQSLNTDPCRLVWQEDKVSILVVLPGLYEVAWGVYSKQLPVVQLMLNGEPVCATTNSTTYTMASTSGSQHSQSSRSSQSGGRVAGLTMVDFLALPAKACIALIYKGEERGQGFLSLRKL